MTSLKTNYISTAELAKLLGISPVAVFKRIKKGQIKAVKIGRSYAIDKYSLEAQFPSFAQSKKDFKEYISVMEAAQVLGVSRGTIFNQIKTCSLEAKKVGRHYVIDKSLIVKGKAQELCHEMVVGKEYVSVPELAGILGISRIAVFKKIKKGQINARKVGRHYAIAKEEVLGRKEEKAVLSAFQYMSVPEVAKHLGLSRIVVFKRIKEGQIKAIKIGRSYAVKKAELGLFVYESNKN